jgi:hypothetical protein
MTPEQKSRQQIDQRLTRCGWLVQDYADMDITAGRGVAVREFPLKTGVADYMLYADGFAIGVIVAASVRGMGEFAHPQDFAATRQPSGERTTLPLSYFNASPWDVGDRLLLPSCGNEVAPMSRPLRRERLPLNAAPPAGTLNTLWQRVATGTDEADKGQKA